MKQKSLIVIFITVILDGIGMGLIMPILPTLLRELAGDNSIAIHYGLLLSLYGLMQFFFAPVLGALSDRFGRRPVLLLSLAGASLDYLIMASTSSLWILYIGRIIAGVTGATGAVAAACIADLSHTTQRAKYFGYLGACIGLGMISGPVIGGLLGAYSPHYPFFAAAILNGSNFFLAYFLLRESHQKDPTSISKSKINPFSSFSHLYQLDAAKSLLVVFFIIHLVGQVPASLWTLFGEDRFQWTPDLIGLSLASFGILHAIFQFFLTGYLVKNWGEKRTLLLGMGCDALAYILIAFANHGWMVIPLMPLFAFGGIGIPALQGFLSNKVDEEKQGQLQGILASLASLASVVVPLFFSFFYANTNWNGWVWIVGAAFYLVSVSSLRSWNNF